MRRIILVSLFVLSLTTACSTVAPDAKATEARIYANVLATITAAAPAPTATEHPLSAFAWVYAAPVPTPSGTVALGATPAAGATPSATPTVTRTPRPAELQFTGFDEAQGKLVRGGLEYLKSCKSSSYDYVRSQLDEIALGDDRAGTLYYFDYGQPVVYVPPKSDVFDAYRYPETSRLFATAVVLVHAAKRLELGDDSGLSQASQYALALFDSCKPKETSADPSAGWLQQVFREWLEEMAAPGCAKGCLYHKPGCDIKGEIYMEWNDKVFYVPTAKSYGAVVMDDTYSHRWFCTENEATAAGWRKAGQ